MSDEFGEAYEDEGSAEPTSWVTRAYLDSVPVRKCAAERRRAWATLLFVTTAGFPTSKQGLQAIDDLTRYLEGGFAGPKDISK